MISFKHSMASSNMGLLFFFFFFGVFMCTSYCIWSQRLKHVHWWKLYSYFLIQCASYIIKIKKSENSISRMWSSEISQIQVNKTSSYAQQKCPASSMYHWSLEGYVRMCELSLTRDPDIWHSHFVTTNSKDQDLEVKRSIAIARWQILLMFKFL